MKTFGELYQTADWKVEKHAPVIECPDEVKSGEAFALKVTVGKQTPHPNLTEHHIRWISVYFQPEGDKFSYEVGHFEFSSHGEAVGTTPNQGPVFTSPEVTVNLKINKPGSLFATSLCNIHGLWQSSKALKVS
jgi:superoxide reductase